MPGARPDSVFSFFLISPSQEFAGRWHVAIDPIKGCMAYRWENEIVTYAVEIMPLRNGRFTWRLMITDQRGHLTHESFEECAEEFDAAAEQRRQENTVWLSTHEMSVADQNRVRSCKGKT
jgi:hypothetical protein